MAHLILKIIKEKIAIEMKNMADVYVNDGMEYTKRWTPIIHHSFPKRIKERIKITLKIHRKNSQLSRLPKDVLFLILADIAVW